MQYVTLLLFIVHLYLTLSNLFIEDPKFGMVLRGNSGSSSELPMYPLKGSSQPYHWGFGFLKAVHELDSHDQRVSLVILLKI